MMLQFHHLRVLVFSFLLMFLIMLGTSPLVSQEETPPVEPPPTETLVEALSTEIFTETPTPIPTFTEIPTLTPTFTDVPPEEPSSTATLSPTPALETPTETPALPATPTETITPTIPATTAVPALPSTTPSGQEPSFLTVPQPETSFLLTSVTVYADDVEDLIREIAEADCNQETIIELNPANPVYTLVEDADPEFFGKNGLPIIRDCAITINGNGTTLERDDEAEDDFRLFGVDSGGILTINDLTLTQGSPTDVGGGAILSVGGEVYLNRVYVLNNDITFETSYQTLGAGVYSYYGILAIAASEFEGNDNLAIDDTDPVGDGGAVASIGGTVAIQTTNFHNNSTSRDGGALAILDNSTLDANIYQSCIVGNAGISVFANWGLGASSNWWGDAAGPLVNQPSTGARDSINSAVTAGTPLSSLPSCGVPATPTPTPTPSPTATHTPTPTYAPSTSLDFTGQHSGLKAVIFWATFRESNLDAVDSGSNADNDLGNPRLSSFLFTSPYCSPSSGAGDNAAEPPPPVNPSQDWYIRHCPEDYRYMAAQAMFNGFLNYERRFGISRVFEYANVNFSGSIGDTGLGLWNLDPQCITSIGSTYSVAYAASSPGNNYAPAISWLDSYMNCIGTSTSTDYKVLRAKRAYTTTILPQINDAVVDFYATPQDYTDAAFQVKVINFGATRTLVACVGGCYINNNLSTIVYTYEAPQDLFNAFAIALGSITQTHVDDAYTTHMQQISTYSGNFHSVAQPVLIISYDLTTGQTLGYVWETEIYQQAGDMSHYPR